MRKYSYGSIMLILLLMAIIAGIFDNIFDDKLSMLGPIILWIGNYIVCRGLLYTREGTFSEYLRGIKTITGKVFLTNILIGLISVVILLLSTLTSGTGLVLSNMENGKIIPIISILYILINAIISLIFAYLNFVMADERYRDLSFSQNIKLIFKSGIRLFSQTLITLLKVYMIPIILSIIIILLAIVVKTMPLIIIIVSILGIAAIIGFVVITPIYMARLSEIYLDNIEEIYED
ncbi:hypothetical protein HKO22_01640 [Peptoniphilus sp. AGMB00490]|uniref:DUF4013 domain-containing protein n=1 Tax=Peptoniphilus faecalis TaxID=2731255 RepID=A0A848REK5_9FIRM|nr:hypothetical protein [Peptoniphilus faecalis]NMW84445.1 hypothetical protein [Peptoniphilus faecalis]